MHTSDSPKEQKSVLVLCTGNSCRSIMAEALLAHELPGVQAFSAGVAATGRVHPLAQQVLQEAGLWRSGLHSKNLDALPCQDFDLVVTVCDHARQSCPVFSGQAAVLHVGFVDPDGQPVEAFRETLTALRQRLLPVVKAHVDG